MARCHSPYPVRPGMVLVGSTQDPAKVEGLALRALGLGFRSFGLKRGPFGTFELYGAHAPPVALRARFLGYGPKGA